MRNPLSRLRLRSSQPSEQKDDTPVIDTPDPAKHSDSPPSNPQLSVNDASDLLPRDTQLTAVAFPGSTDIARPASLTDEQCSSLHVKPIHDPSLPTFAGVSYNRIVSRWTLTDEQRRSVAAGADILLSVVGTGHPAVMLYAAGSEETQA